MKPYKVKINKNFIGRDFERNLLLKVAKEKQAKIIIIYGRRRIGKTELLEQTFHDRNILKFEGIEGEDESFQLKHCLEVLFQYTGDKLISDLNITSWKNFFELINEKVKNKKFTIYLEEVQWLANYNTTMIAELKYVWDNYFRHNKQLIVVLCGSSPSFMINKVVHSRSLYNRSQHEIHLEELDIHESKEYLKKRSNREIMDAILTVGSVPEYLKWLNKGSSIFLGLCENAFCKNSFFVNEYERIFTSNMANKSHYKKIIEVLSKKKFATRAEIAKSIKSSSGGKLTEILDDLEKSGFITKYYPFNLNENTILKRYAISDNYLQFYFNFIKPIKKQIQNGDYNNNYHMAIKKDRYLKWLGFAFERWCRKNHRLIAKHLGFSGIEYKSGVFFNKSSNSEDPGYQIDLIFDRSDHVYTICEIKYSYNKVKPKVVADFDKKMELFENKKNRTIQRVLICTLGAEDSVLNQPFFDAVITLDDLML